MKKIILPVSLGLAHGVSDCSAGMLLGSLTNSISIYGVGSLVLLYNILAFGAQPLAGLFTDKYKNPRLASVSGLGLMCLAILLFFVNPVASVILAGAASALFHVGGGALALCATPGKASGPGLFSAPGVAGLAIGGYLAVNEIFPAFLFISLLVILAAVLFVLKMPELPYDAPKEENTFDGHDMIMLFLLLAIALRSAVWNVFQYVEHGEISNIVLISLSAAGGKIFGGYAGDKIGWKKYSLYALFIAIPLLILGETSIYFLLPGIALLQSVTPIVAAAMFKSISKLPATSAGISFGLAIAVGGIPFIAGINREVFLSPFFIGGTLIIAAVLIWKSLNNKLNGLNAG